MASDIVDTDGGPALAAAHLLQVTSERESTVACTWQRFEQIQVAWCHNGRVFLRDNIRLGNDNESMEKCE